MREIELLAPAANKDVAVEAILHGADAVYIGADSHGARKKAANSIDDIAEVVQFAHRFRAKVYVTVNTLVYDNELSRVERLVRNLYRIGVDAIIVQDMSILEMDIPPISLHASTQCDNRNPAKAKFLEAVGFSQIVLARELTIAEIKATCDAVTIPIECFVHGALCVCYSGRCAASYSVLGRSANRGECAQMCRMPYTLRDARGNVIVKNKYLLSLRDFNTLGHIEDLLQAGVSSFKIEGRLKDADYVKNIVSAYRRELDEIISRNCDKYRKSSFGTSYICFEPNPAKSFNRGFTDYFLGSRRPRSLASLRTPKSMGEVITDTADLHNGDGISFFDGSGDYQGMNVNGISKSRIIGSSNLRIPKGAEIHRTYDIFWQKAISGKTAKRRIWVDMSIDENGLSLKDERGLEIRLSLEITKDIARRKMNPEVVLGKLGDTIYILRNFENHLDPETFIPASELAALRRRAVALLDSANRASYKYDYRRIDNPDAVYPDKHLSPRDNVANKLAEQFYLKHGVETIEPAVELLHSYSGPVMTTRYCILRELGMCKKDYLSDKICEPLTISTGPHAFRLSFDCSRCEMTLHKD